MMSVCRRAYGLLHRTTQPQDSAGLSLQPSLAVLRSEGQHVVYLRLPTCYVRLKFFTQHKMRYFNMNFKYLEIRTKPLIKKRVISRSSYLLEQSKYGLTTDLCP